MVRYLLLLWLAFAELAFAQPTSRMSDYPATQPRGRRQIIPGRFIVTIQESADASLIARDHGVTPEFIYQRVIRGFAGPMSEAARVGLVGDRRVIRVEPDVVVTADATGWAQDRVDQRTLPLDGVYRKNYTGAGVTAYVVDGGIRYDHAEFGGRATFGYDVYGGNGSDCGGHGTHVASTIGGTNYGTAPGVSLVSVRVMDCTGSGTMSGVIAGLDWIMANRRAPCVVNMSLGGPSTTAMDDAVVRLTNAGVLVAVAAGNEGVDACNTSPARAADALTVGATDQSDVRATFSNYGNCLDLFAPGVSIPGAWYSAPSDYAYMSGTSSATPLVAGAAALLLQHYPSIAARALRDSIYNHATKGRVASSLTGNNHLLFTLEQNDGVTSVSPTPTPNLAPVASFTTSCTNLACSFVDRSTDADGSIASWRWNFGNGATATSQNVSYSYPSSGTYTVTLTVTDNQGAQNSTSQVVTVSPSVTTTPTPTTSINLAASGYKSRSYVYVQLQWGGASTTTVDLYRNNVKIKTLNNTGNYTDATGAKNGTFSYRICNAGSTTCSPTKTVTF
jgi:PKD repeat protein